ncbi:DUF1259 domain-containing protein [Mechercharimyces sp. CAU 1602]|uniref:DUF1259 domain-containing protein n=1 Tax=Mechercharimyces sp. CAU 1602 TaxID=2973933 RepID=UPI002163DFE9|nr:DUF1259 domain-containing protein [Mechercharimyces sp. CAU 1602]MCS1351336.1 DUF1259 domain-containing protein [Mechercharimyces sp. CAU 1602]
MNITPVVCEQLGRILDARVVAVSQPGPSFCIVRNLRPFSATILDKNSTEIRECLYSFQQTNISGQTLNLGWIAVLENEVTPLMNMLSAQNITVTQSRDFSLFTSPRVILVYYQVIENPFVTAVKLRRIMNTLGTVFPPRVPPTPAFERLCSTFAQIVRATDVINVTSGFCETIAVRRIPTTIDGQLATTSLVLPRRFLFESLGSDGRALCQGTVVLLRSEVLTFLNAIRRQGGLIDVSINGRYFTQPDLNYFTYIACENPIVFAQKTSRALRSIGL